MSEMLEVIEKASKMHAENALHKSLEQSRSEEGVDDNAIVFKKVSLLHTISCSACPYAPLELHVPMGMPLCTSQLDVRIHIFCI